MTPELFEVITSESQKKRFVDLWLKICDEKKFEEDLESEYFKRYMIKSTEGQDIGTLSLIHYHPETYSVLNDYFPFYEVKEIIDFPNRLMEIDKVSIDKNFRGKKYLNVILAILVNNAIEHNLKYYVAILDELFFKLLTRYYHVPIQKVGPAMQDVEYNCYPVVVDIETYITDEKHKKDVEEIIKNANSFIY